MKTTNDEASRDDRLLRLLIIGSLVLLTIGALAGATVTVIGAIQKEYAIAALGAALCAGAIGVAVKLPSPGSSD